MMGRLLDNLTNGLHWPTSFAVIPRGVVVINCADVCSFHVFELNFTIIPLISKC